MIAKLLCKAFGHAESVDRQGVVPGNTPAIASFCSRCGLMLRLRSGSRSERRRLRFGR